MRSSSELASGRPGASLWRRLVWLGLCVAAGCVVGFVGQSVTGSSAWFLAIPMFVLLAWLFVADPTACLPAADRPSSTSSGPR